MEKGLPSKRRLLLEHLEVRLALSTILGSVYSDANRNAVRDAGETPLSGWHVYLDNNSNQKFDYYSGEPYSTTDVNGEFVFNNVPAREHTVRLIQRPEWQQTAPSPELAPAGNVLGSVIREGISGLRNPQHVLFGPDGFVYISDIYEIRRYNATTGEYLGIFVPMPAQSMAFGPDGDLYVGDAVKRQILRFNGVSGALSDVFIEPGSGGLSWPSSLAFGPDGYLYVANTSGTRGILRYDAETGAFSDVFIEGVINGEIVVGTDGALYVASGTNVRKYQISTGLLEWSSEVPPGTLCAANALTLGASGEIYAASRSTHEIFRFDTSDGSFLGTFIPALPRVNGGLRGPSGLAIGPDGHLYVTSYSTEEVLKYEVATGRYLGALLSTGKLYQLDSITFDRAGRMYVAHSDDVTVFDHSTGELLASLAGNKNSQMNATTDILITPSGEAYVASRDSDEVLSFDPISGDFLHVVVPAGRDGLDAPLSMLMAPDNSFYVYARDDNLPTSEGRLFHYSLSGQLLGVITPQSPLSAIVPAGFAFASDGRLYLSWNEGNNGVIAEHDPQTGTIVRQVASFDRGFGSSMAIAPNGDIYVPSIIFDGAIYRFRATTGNTWGNLFRRKVAF